MSASISPISPDAFEKSSSNTDQAPSPRPSTTSANSDWYLNKRGSRSSRGSASSGSISDVPSKAAVTPLPPSIEASLAILTAGLSVAAFHGVKSLSDRRAAKKLASQERDADLSRAGSVLVPSTVPEQMEAPPIELPAATAPIAELEGSPRELPPAYSEEPQSVVQKKS